MALLVALARGLLAGAFAVSATAKVRDRAGTREALANLGLPPSLDLTLATVEGFTALGLLIERRTPAAAWVALGLFAGFSVFVAVQVARGNDAPCPCFGATHPAPMGPRTLVRNLALMAVAVVATGDVGTVGWAIWISAAVCAGVIWWWGARRGGASRSRSAG